MHHGAYEVSYGRFLEPQLVLKLLCLHKAVSTCLSCMYNTAFPGSVVACVSGTVVLHRHLDWWQHV